jgi:hypothetical protein
MFPRVHTRRRRVGVRFETTATDARQRERSGGVLDDQQRGANRTGR